MQVDADRARTRPTRSCSPAPRRGRVSAWSRSRSRATGCPATTSSTRRSSSATRSACCSWTARPTPTIPLEAGDHFVRTALNPALVPDYYIESETVSAVGSQPAPPRRTRTSSTCSTRRCRGIASHSPASPTRATAGRSVRRVRRQARRVRPQRRRAGDLRRRSSPRVARSGRGRRPRAERDPGNRASRTTGSSARAARICFRST